MIVPFHYINNSNISYDQYHFWSMHDVEMMNRALEIAKQGAKFGEIPVGAVVVYEGRILGEGYNCPITTQDPTAHAEIVAVRRACETLEPCTMCFGALIHARISRVVFGAFEPKAGVVVSQLKLPEQVFYNHHLSVYGGLLADKSSALLSGFFRQRRQEKRALKTQA